MAAQVCAHSVHQPVLGPRAIVRPARSPSGQQGGVGVHRLEPRVVSILGRQGRELLNVSGRPCSSHHQRAGCGAMLVRASLHVSGLCTLRTHCKAALH